MTMSEVEVDRITQQVFAARNSGLDAALVKVVIDEIEAATTTEAMLATLVERGVLTEETRTRLDGYAGMVDTGTGAGPMVIARAATNERRLVTVWEVTG